ncbi:ubiquitin carboxyl-terminal hydrolase-domain-containing protein [Stachybotrys elegans]|uniref:ubiquitinyl hydrolase 1 n=1 Tax=Stachybotrys elegans TaxID=80388 RepID=A0A8K0WSI6_9HYPO|nr:ubiquitin carboxyl-terminal hydrolase-domain-containing protein [Stachybotrys elegans]
MKDFPRKFLSLRDKNGPHRRSKSVPPGNKAPRPLTNIFKPDPAKQNQKDEAEREAKEDALVEQIQDRLEELNITDVTTEHIKAILASRYANGDPEKAVEFIDIEQKASAGIIVSYDPSVEMVGAENRGAVTCYLDALLFAMFSKMDAFECMFKTDFPPDDHRSKLVKLLIIWVNMLRSGKLIPTDFTKALQDALADCGWSDARMLEQQDTSEAFGFITETLQLPLLSLQVDLFHQGKNDADDHKVVYERLLNLAVPPDPEGKGLKLEDCLEEYFNAKVDVSRDSEEVKKPILDEETSEKDPPSMHRAPSRLITLHEGKQPLELTLSPEEISPPSQVSEASGSASPAGLTPPTMSEESTKAGSPDIGSDRVETPQQESSPGVDVRGRPGSRHRSTSIIQRVMIDEQGRASSAEDPTMLQRTLHRGSTVVKAVTIPAWQFFRLIPWNAVSNNEPRNNVEVAMNFDQKPVVGICLKRYAMTRSGLPQRHNTFIDIPDSMSLPYFMLPGEQQDDDDEKDLNTNYKLVLQSVICHRGDSLQSGHYIAFARVASKLLTDHRRHDFDPPPDYEQAQWVRFDDLDIERRVTYIDDIRTALKEEMPYLLFYQILPTVDAACPSTEGTEADPPSYNESRASMEMPPTPSIVESHRMVDALARDGYFDDTPTAETFHPLQSKPPSIRLSVDSDQPLRRSTDGAEPRSHTGSVLGDSRRQSVNLGTPDGPSPASTPGEESTASRLARAANRFSRNMQSRPSSRPPSQSGENRLNVSKNRLSGFIKLSRDDLHALSAAASDTTTASHGEASTAEKVSSDLARSQLLPTENSKKGSKKNKPKEKASKNKASHQPDRECVVM